MGQKRIRSVNWDDEEKKLFRSVLKEYALIIENKALDTNTNKLKTKAWNEVHKKFNNINRRQRELSQLKIQWKIMKVNARKTYSSLKNKLDKNGSGERPKTPDESVIEVIDLLNPADLLEDNNIDSDGSISEDTNQTSTENKHFLHSMLSKSDPQQEILNNTGNEFILHSTWNGFESKKGPNVGRECDNSVTHSTKIWGDEHHRRTMQMAEEEHAIKMAIHKEKLKAAILEREILELKKRRELNEQTLDS